MTKAEILDRLGLDPGPSEIEAAVIDLFKLEWEKTVATIWAEEERRILFGNGTPGPIEIIHVKVDQ